MSCQFLKLVVLLRYQEIMALQKANMLGIVTNKTLSKILRQKQKYWKFKLDKSYFNLLSITVSIKVYFSIQNNALSKISLSRCMIYVER
jgi:hypothetical protein